MLKGVERVGPGFRPHPVMSCVVGAAGRTDRAVVVDLHDHGHLADHGARTGEGVAAAVVAGGSRVDRVRLAGVRGHRQALHPHVDGRRAVGHRCGELDRVVEHARSSPGVRSCRAVCPDVGRGHAARQRRRRRSGRFCAHDHRGDGECGDGCCDFDPLHDCSLR